MTKKELEALVRQLTEQNAELTRLLTAAQMEIKARQRTGITYVMPEIYPQPFTGGTAPLPRWWEEAKMWN